MPLNDLMMNYLQLDFRVSLCSLYF